MVKWRQERTINEPIDKVWQLFSDKEIKRLFPKVEEHQLLEGEEDSVGAKHAQSYTEGKQLQHYMIETTVFDDTPERKVRETQFTMSQLFEVTYRYIVERVNNTTTRFIYEGRQKGVNLTAKTMLLTGSKARRQETINAFMHRVEVEARK